MPLSPDELLELAFDQAPQATIVTSADWRVMHWGLAAQALFGWAAQDAVGEPLDLLTGPGRGSPGPRLRELANAQPGGVSRQVVMRRHQDGRLMHVEVSWRTVRGEDGETRFHVVGNRDVTAEQVRRDVDLVNERYRDLLDSVPEAIVIGNDVGSIVLFNAEAARLFGVAADAMIGLPIEQLIPERFARGHALHRERFASAPQRRPMGSGLELRGRRGDGSEFPVEVSLSPLVMGKRRLAMAALRDLSERMRLEEAQRAFTSAQLASSAKTEFLSRMSHELRTPLNAILGFAQVLGADVDRRLDETQHRQLAQILRAGRHLLAMMNDLLDVTRIETGALSLSLDAVEVLSVVEEVVAICEPTADEAGVEVHFDVAPDDLCARADRLRLRQVLLNLVTNGIKYNRRGGRVDVRASRSEGAVRISVRDTGQGLSAEQLSRLYRPFDRLGAEGGPVEGNGIGLVIARGMVDGMGGRLDVESELGVGTVFSVGLPAAKTRSGPLQGQDLARPEDGQKSRAGPASLSMLYVEDNTPNIEVMQAMVALRPEWRLQIARTGAEATQCVLSARPDVVVVDMHLPDTLGVELVRRWDADPSLAGIPRVALSADATEVQAGAAAAQGFARYFTKPLDMQVFLAWLDAQVGQRSHRP